MCTADIQLGSKEITDLVISNLDWRFLLPNPNPKTSLCLTEGTLAKAIEAISESTIRSEFNPQFNEFDLAAISDPDDKQLNYVMSILKPGASCYLEWEVGVFFRPKSIKKKLKEAGFDLIDLYIPKPNPDIAPPAIWIPLESYGAINFLIKNSHQYKSKSMFNRFGVVLRRALWLLAPGLFINFPWFISSGQRRFKVCSIARKPNISGKGSNTRLLKNRLLEMSKIFSDNRYNEESERLDIIIISGGQNRLNKVVLVVFNEDSISPSYIVKIPRVEGAELALKNEVNTLNALKINYHITNEIPQVLFNNYKLGFYSIGENFIVGNSLGNILNSDNSSSLAKKLTRWLIEFSKKSATKIPYDWRNGHIKPLFEELETVFRHSVDPKLINKTNDIIMSLEIPRFVCEHRDFAPWNILVASDERFGVLDWESSRLDGIPGLDLIYFITYLCFYIEGAWSTDKALACYKMMLDSNTFIGNLFHDCFNLYATEIGLSTHSIHPLRIITWITHLISVLKQAPKVKPFSIDMGHDTRSLFRSLLKHEMSCL